MVPKTIRNTLKQLIPRLPGPTAENYKAHNSVLKQSPPPVSLRM